MKSARRPGADAAVSAALLAIGALLFALSFGDEFDVPVFGGDPGPAFMPRIFLGGWICLAGIALLNSLRLSGDPGESVNLRQLAGAVGTTVLYGIAIGQLGFLIASVPGFFAFCWIFGYRRIRILLPVSIAAPLAVWAVFRFGFELLLPRSPWFHLF